MSSSANIAHLRIERPVRRGIALLLVLIAVVLGLTAATIAAQVAVTAGVTRRLDVATREADDVAASLAPRIERWLVTESQQAVVPVESPVPAIAIADDRVDLGSGKSMRVRVTAFDQHGMVPWGEAVSSGPLSGSLTPGAIELARAAPRGSVESPIQPGLDLLGGTTARGVWPAHIAMRDPSGPKRFAGEDSAGQANIVAEEPETEASDRPSLGSMIATHLTGNARPAINFNTAPRSLISFAESITGRSVWSVVEETRAQGKPAALGSFAPPASDAQSSTGAPSEADRAPIFVASSDLWSFRVDVTIDRARSSWWLTYSRSDRGWLLRQRLRITG